MIIYPAIDLMNNRVVRLTKGAFDSITDYSQDPLETAQKFANSGATHLHVVDLDGAREGTVSQRSTLRDILQTTRLQVQVGGGIRTAAQALSYLEAGACRVVIGSLAVKAPLEMQQLLKIVKPSHVTLAVDFRLDATRTPRVAVQGWKTDSEIKTTELIKTYLDHGIHHILCTDIGRDGTLAGPDVDLYQEWQNQFSELEIQVSGGIGSLSHLAHLKNTGAKAVIVGKALYEGKFSLEEALKC